MPNGRTVTLWLMDNDPSGRIKCSMFNWTGVVYRVPRTLIDKCKEEGIECLNQTGIYFLFGFDNNDTSPVDVPVVYVGQAVVRQNGKGLLDRIVEPHREIEYWTEAVILTTTNNSFGPTEVNYLEHEFYRIAKEAGRYSVKNANSPNPGNPTQEIQSNLTEFLSYSKLVMGLLGHKLFEPVIPHTTEEDSEPIFTYSHTWGTARGKRTNEGFAILAGSVIRPFDEIVNSCPNVTRGDRLRYANCIENNVLIADIPFPNPSRAAEFVTVNSVSGNSAWKDENGNNPGMLIASE